MMQDRYSQLHIHAALSRRCDYSQACKELAFLLRKVYVGAPKGVQLAMYQDVLTAFRFIAEIVDTSQQLGAAAELLQAVEAVLPKQRKIAAVSAYKQGAIAQHRRRAAKREQESGESGEGDGDGGGGDFAQLSTDVLLHVFGFLDPLSLGISSAVCRAWNDTAQDDNLWRTHFVALFGSSSSSSSSSSSKFVQGTKVGFGGLHRNHEAAAVAAVAAAAGAGASEGKQQQQQQEQKQMGFWQSALAERLSQPGWKLRLRISNRKVCMGCRMLYWISESPRLQATNRSNCRHQNHAARPASVAQVVTFVFRESESSGSSSSSDSDSDEEMQRRFAKLWVYPRLMWSNLSDGHASAGLHKALKMDSPCVIVGEERSTLLSNLSNSSNRFDIQ